MKKAAYWAALAIMASAGMAWADEGDGGTHLSYVLPGGSETNMHLGGYVQANAEFGDVNAYDGNLPPNHRVDDRFRLRRARLGAWGDVLENFDYKIMGDFAQNDGFSSANGVTRSAMSGTDIYINYHQFSEANVKMGQFDTPFGMEQYMIPDMFTLTPERSEVTEALRPERQLGVMLWGKPLSEVSPDNKDFLKYWLGMFNGDNRNNNANDNQQFMYMGRLELQPLDTEVMGSNMKWNVGADGYISKDATNALLTQTGNDWVQSDGSLKAMTVQTPQDSRTAGGIDQRLEWGLFTLQAEYLQTKYKNALVADPDFTASGYWVLAAYQVIPKTWEVVGKWESFDPKQKANDTISTVTGGINYYPKACRDTRDIVLMLDYMHTEDQFRQDNPSQGPDAFNEVMLRAEFMF